VATAAQGTERARVTVETDVLRVLLDTRGGTVVSAMLLKYPESITPGALPVKLMSEDPQHYFVAQSGFVSAQGHAPDHRTVYRSAAEHYRLGEGEDTLEIPLSYEDAEGLRFTKRYRFTRGSYLIGLDEHVENASQAEWRGNPYRQLQRVAPPGSTGFSLTNPQTYSFVGAAWYSPDKHFEKLKFENFAKEPLNREIQGGWAAFPQHYYFAAWLPPPAERDAYATQVVAGTLAPRYVLRTLGPTVALAPGASADVSTRLYLGPKLQEVLPEIAPGLGLVVDYGYVTVLSNPLFWLLSKLHWLTGNWGFAIIALVLLIKAAFFKLSEAQYRSMAKMRKLQPRMAALKERYGDDREKLNAAMLELYQKEKINPMGGCLPVLVQIPVFIALYWVLVESVELRQAPFIGWIKSLTDQDPYFVLPVLNGLVMIVTQRLSPTTGMDPMQQRMMQIMPLAFAVMFAFFPAGLVLYWTVNGLLGLLQQWVITRRIEAGAKA